MGREWDGAHDIAFKPETWSALAEHLLPGAFILAFASSRGWHRLACAMEDVGLIMQPSIFVNGMVRDVPLCLGWACGSAFPKSTRIDNQIDKVAGIKNRPKVWHDRYHDGITRQHPDNEHASGKAGLFGCSTNTNLTELAVTPLARAWQGHRYGGQILRNALEPIIVAQKPWTGKRLDCIVETGAGAINVGGGRIPTGSGDPNNRDTTNHKDAEDTSWFTGNKDKKHTECYTRGRWPQNLILVHTEFCQRVGERKVKSSERPNCQNKAYGAKTSTIYGKYEHNMHQVVRSDADGLETVATWRCLIACPECGYTWLAVDKEVCPECKAMGEWQCAVRRLGEQGGKNSASYRKAQPDRAYTDSIFPKPKLNRGSRGHNDSGDCTRYFFNADWSLETAEQLAKVDPAHYCPKSSRRERDAGLLGAMPCVKCGKLNSRTHLNDKGEEVPCRRNGHETIKPLTLTRYLATLLLSPPEYAPRRILIPFFGVGSEGIGAMLADFEEIVGIEMDAEYCTIGEARMKYWASRPEQMRLL